MDKEQAQIIQDAFNELPKVVQESITNADVKAQLRKLAKTYSLHLDKWVILENLIMMALLGIIEPRELPDHIVEKIGLSKEQSVKITNAVVAIVFDPIQEKLKDNVGEAQNTLESIDSEVSNIAHKSKIDISKFSGAPTDPQVYRPKTNKQYPTKDPYHESID